MLPQTEGNNQTEQQQQTIQEKYINILGTAPNLQQGGGRTQ